MKRKRVFVAIVMLGLTTGAMVALLVRWRSAERRDKCVAQMQIIHCAMTCCYPMEHGLTNGAPIDLKEFACYMPYEHIPRCPCGPEYKVVWKVGGPPPVCSIHGSINTNAEKTINQERK